MGFVFHTSYVENDKFYQKKSSEHGDGYFISILDIKVD